MRVGLAIATLALSLATAVAPSAAVPRRPAADWSRTAIVTPEGGVRIGSPRAKARLVEYGSFTCPHCGAFAREGFAPIVDRYVRTGRLSFEFRPALRDRVDLVAALTARCGGAQRFFQNAEALFAAQDDWTSRAAGLAPAQDGAAPLALDAIADQTGIAGIAARQGVSHAALARCLADKSTLSSLESAAEDAWNVRKIGGTPSFYLNGDKLDGIYGWAALEPQLRAAIHD